MAAISANSSWPDLTSTTNSLQSQTWVRYLRSWKWQTYHHLVVHDSKHQSYPTFQASMRYASDAVAVVCRRAEQCISPALRLQAAGPHTLSMSSLSTNPRGDPKTRRPMIGGHAKRVFLPAYSEPKFDIESYCKQGLQAAHTFSWTLLAQTRGDSCLAVCSEHDGRSFAFGYCQRHANRCIFSSPNPMSCAS